MLSYIQVLLQLMLLMAVSFAIKPIFLMEKHEPFKFFYLLAFATILMIFSSYFKPEHGKNRQLPQVKLWQFVIGWCIFFADTNFRRILSGHLLIIIAGIQFVLVDRSLGLEDPMVTIGMAMLLVGKIKITVIKPLNHIIYALAGASLFIFLSHRQFFVFVQDNLTMHKQDEGIISVIVALVGGYVLWMIWEFISDKVRHSSSKA
jgi:hypothetical protein